jgi:hypothetical protein
MNNPTAYQVCLERLATLDFFQDEVKYYQHQLAQIASRDPEYQYHQRTVTFRQRLLDILEQIDELRHTIYSDQQGSLQADGATPADSGQAREDQSGSGVAFQDLASAYEQLKADFHHFYREVRSA